MNKYKKLYDTNPKVKRFVDEYIRTTNKTVDEALTHRMVRTIIDSYVAGGINYETRTL